MKSFLSILILLVFNVLQVYSQSLNNIESVEYDALQNRFFISNGNSIIARSSDGTLSFFGSGSATHGMEVLGNHLFVIDGDFIRGYELDSENEVMTLNIPGAGFLNGLTNDGVSTLYATDFSTKKIIKIDVSDLSNPTSELIVNNTSTTPNGIVYDGDSNRLIFVNWGNNAPIKAVDLTDNSVSTIITTSFGNIDGIDEDNDGNYYISTWSPDQIVKYDNTFANAPEIVTTPFLSNPADIGYAKAIDTLAIPHYPGGGNQVTLVGFEIDTMTTSSFDIFSNEFQLEVFPNPIQNHSIIQFSLKENTSLELKFYNNKGELVKTMLEGEQSRGHHRINFVGANLSSGIYFCTLKSRGLLKTLKVFVE